MSDVAITAANVAKGTGAKTLTLIAAVAIAQGQTMYADSTVTPAVWRLGDNNATADASAVSAIALNAAAINQPCTGQTDGDIAIGGTLSAGMIYCQSATAGGICPITDLVSGAYATILGWAPSTSVLRMSLLSTRTALPADIT